MNPRTHQSLCDGPHARRSRRSRWTSDDWVQWLPCWHPSLCPLAGDCLARGVELMTRGRAAGQVILLARGSGDGERHPHRKPPQQRCGSRVQGPWWLARRVGNGEASTEARAIMTECFAPQHLFHHNTYRDVSVTLPGPAEEGTVTKNNDLRPFPSES